jgi:serine/threonine-protein kinase
VDSQPTVISKQPPPGVTPPVAHMHPSEMGRVLEGQTLGHYHLLEFVGGGGMGAVFRALDTMLNRIVAVKVLSHDQSGDEETLRRFKNEAQSAARLDHENIGRVHYVGEDGGWHYIVFEFIEGINLRDLVQRDGPLPVADAVRYMLQLGDALTHAARRDVVHRDIKPSNVLISPEYKAKLVDMGLARLHQVEHANNDLTASGVTLGTFDYISPEQARDPRSADVRSDLYSLGCTFYFMLTGRPPFPEGTVLQKLLQHQGDEPPDPRQFCPQLPDDVYHILKRLLAKSPLDRYQKPGELVAELSAAAARMGLRPSSPGSMMWLPAAPLPSQQWRQALPWLAPLAALVLIVVLLNMVWSPNDEQPPALLGRLPKAEHPTRQGVVGTDARRDDTSPRRDRTTPGDRKTSVTGQQTLPQPVRGTDGPLAARRSAMEMIPWIESAAPVHTNIASRVWTTVQSDDFASKLTSARQTYVVPFEINLRGNNAATTPAPIPGERVVAGKQAGPSQYESLAVALREAKSGDVIVLRFNGELDEEPLDIANTKLTIRAAQDYTPVIRFRPDEEDVLAERRSMISVDGGQIAFHNVHFDFTPPAESSDHWSLFDLNHAEGLRLSGCTVTVRNTSQSFDRPTAGMINVRAGLAENAGMMKDAFPARRPLEIQVRQSVFRGEAGFLRFGEGQPIELTAENMLFALSERFADGDVGLMDARNSPSAKFELRHCTILASGGLMRLTNDNSASQLMPVTVECFDSILAAGGSAVMIEQVADETTETLRRYFSWRGDRSYYDGFATLWRINTGAGIQDFDYRKWRGAWGDDENLTYAGPVGWARPPAMSGRPMSELTAGDFALRFDESPARGAASAGEDAGALREYLPRVPERRSSTSE